MATERDHNLAILVDLQGPKIRVGLVDDNGVKLDRGREVMLVAGIDRCAEPDIPVVYPALADDVRRATRSCSTTAPSACGSSTSRASGSAARSSGAAWSSPARA